MVRIILKCTGHFISCDERQRGIHHTHLLFDICIDTPGRKPGPADLHTAPALSQRGQTLSPLPVPVAICTMSPAGAESLPRHTGNHR